MEYNRTLLRINELLELRNWTMYRLAKEADIPYSSLNSLFQKNNQPTLSTLEKICAGFRISLSDFFAEGTKSYTPTVDYTDEDMQLIISVHELSKKDRQLLFNFAEMLKNR